MVSSVRLLCLHSSRCCCCCRRYCYLCLCMCLLFNLWANLLFLFFKYSRALAHTRTHHTLLGGNVKWNEFNIKQFMVERSEREWKTDTDQTTERPMIEPSCTKIGYAHAFKINTHRDARHTLEPKIINCVFWLLFFCFFPFFNSSNVN